eukprot:2774898-Amphidinium_carterae.1
MDGSCMGVEVCLRFESKHATPSSSSSASSSSSSASSSSSSLSSSGGEEDESCRHCQHECSARADVGLMMLQLTIFWASCNQGEGVSCSVLGSRLKLSAVFGAQD